MAIAFSLLTLSERRMSVEMNRRSFLGIGISTALLSPAGLGRGTALHDRNSAVAGVSFPQQDPALVQEMVAASHSNLVRVKELLAQQPSFAKAAYDWGFGDWETALGAASHVGNKAIAALLLEAGARPTIFSAAMLGQLSVVRAFVEASPGIQRTLGPHSISLLAHARAGGAAAQPVVDYLVSVGGADSPPVLLALTAADREALVGTYVFGTEANERFEIGLTGETLTIQRAGYSKRNIRHVGNNEFYPVGAEAVRLRFERTTGNATAVAVFAPAPIVTAKRVAG